MRIKKIINAGDVREIEITCTFKGSDAPRAPRQAPTPEEKAARNWRNSIRLLGWIINANFSNKDRFVTLTHGHDVSPQQAEAALTRFIRQMQKLYRILGLPPLKYVAVTENKHKSGRIHHHIVMGGEVDAEIIEQVWQHGHVIQSRMYGKDFTGLAHYISKDPVQPHKRKWRQSKGLIHPQVKYEPLSPEDKTDADIRTPRGYKRVYQKKEWYESIGLWKYAKFVRTGGVDLSTGPEEIDP